MRKWLFAAIALALNSFPASAQTLLQHYQPGPRLIDGSQLNRMVDAVNNIQGNGTASNIKIGNGTVSLPSLAFGSDTDTGIYRIGANNIGVAASGAKVLDVATTGLGVTGVVTVTSAGASALAVGRLGATTPAFLVDASTATSLTGLKVTAAGTGNGVALTALGGTNESIYISAKGTGFTQFGTAAGVPQHVTTAQMTAPALTSCGGGTPAIVGTDTAGIVTMGTTATGCIITFNAAYTTAPFCVVSWIATPLMSQSYVTSNVAITLTQTSASGNVVQYVCVGTAGG